MKMACSHRGIVLGCYGIPTNWGRSSAIAVSTWFCSWWPEVSVRSRLGVAVLPSCAVSDAHRKDEAFGVDLGNTRFAPRYQFFWMLDDSVAAVAVIGVLALNDSNGLEADFRP